MSPTSTFGDVIERNLLQVWLIKTNSKVTFTREEKEDEHAYMEHAHQSCACHVNIDSIVLVN